MTATLYEILGVRPDADDAALGRAYRQRAKQCHPDRNPERGELFKQLADAYAVLSDPERRRRYDETGETDTTPEGALRREALKALGQILGAIIGNDLERMKDTTHRPLIEEIRKVLDRAIEEWEERADKLRQHRQAIIEVAERIEAAEGQENILASVARAPLEQLDAELSHVAEQLAIHKLAHTIAGEHTFRSAAPARPRENTASFSNCSWPREINNL